MTTRYFHQIWHVAFLDLENIVHLIERTPISVQVLFYSFPFPKEIDTLEAKVILYLNNLLVYIYFFKISFPWKLFQFWSRTKCILENCLIVYIARCFTSSKINSEGSCFCLFHFNYVYCSIRLGDFIWKGFSPFIPFKKDLAFPQTASISCKCLPKAKKLSCSQNLFSHF